jgi:DNA-binding response OmpR family regulator
MARVLVVEDEFLIAMSLVAALEAEEHEVRQARDGRQALDVLGDFRPDVVVTDYMMPRMDGAELIRRIRGTPELGGVRVIMMTAIPEGKLASERLPYDAYMPKPFREAELVARVEQLAGKRGETP